MQLAIEQLPGNQVKKTVHYYKGSFQFHHVTIETQADGPEGAAAENEEALTVELPTSFEEAVFIPGKGIVSVGTDELYKADASTPIGVEGAVPTLDRHLRYRREIEVQTADGREILIQVVGRTNLAKGNKDAASLAIQGDSQLQMRILVKRWDGQTSFEEVLGTGNSLNEAIPVCAGHGNFAELLLQPGTPTEGFLDAAIAKANMMLPALAKPELEDKKQIGTYEQEEGDPNSVKTDKQLANPEIVDPIGHAEKKPELKPWNEMTMEEKREEAWETFKDNFSWKQLLVEILAGVAMMIIAITGVKLLGPALLVWLGAFAVGMGLWTIIAPYLDGKSTSVVEWIKGGLLILGGAALIVAAVATSPGWGPVAGGIALVSFLAYAVVELINSKMTYEEAIQAPTREEMQTEVKESAIEAKNGIRDLVLAIQPPKKMGKGIDGLLEPVTKGGTSPKESIFANEETGGMGAASADEALPQQVEEPVAAIEEEALVAAKEELPVAEGLQTGGLRNALGLPAIEKVQIRFKPSAAHDPVEFARQAKAQEDGLNKLTVEQYLANRDRYLKEGRAPEGSKAQKKMRDAAVDDKAAQILDENPEMDYDQALAEAKEWVKGQAVLHDPDQVVGGNPDNVTGLGDARVNSSIGSQWSKKAPGSSMTRAERIDKLIRDAAKNMSVDKRKNTYLNVDLEF